MEVRGEYVTLGQGRKSVVEWSPSLVEVTVSTAAFCFDGHQLRVLLTRPVDGASMDFPSLPFRVGAGLLEGAREVLRSTGLEIPKHVHQVAAFDGQPLGVGRGAVEVVSFAICRPDPRRGVAGDVMETHVWMPVMQHAAFGEHLRGRLEVALEALRHKARFGNMAFDFLNEEFSLSELQRVFEAILGKSIDVRNFRKKIEALDILAESPNKPRGMAYRPPRLFRFDTAKFLKRLEEEGEIRFF